MLRPFSGSARIGALVMALPMEASVVFTCAASALTATLSETAPTSILRSSVRGTFTCSRTSFTVTSEKPAALALVL